MGLQLGSRVRVLTTSRKGRIGEVIELDWLTAVVRLDDGEEVGFRRTSLEEV